MIRIVRRLAGVALLALAARWLLVDLVARFSRPTSFALARGDGPHGPVTLRVSPLTADEAVQARARERDAFLEAWGSEGIG